MKNIKKDWTNEWNEKSKHLIKLIKKKDNKKWF